ncbi:hypothetical protein AOLI_G00075130 [Acnodon oligacanthus]
MANSSAEPPRGVTALASALWLRGWSCPQAVALAVKMAVTELPAESQHSSSEPLNGSISMRIEEETLRATAGRGYVLPARI